MSKMVSIGVAVRMTATCGALQLTYHIALAEMLGSVAMGFMICLKSNSLIFAWLDTFRCESYIGKRIGTRAVPQFTTGVAKPLTQIEPGKFEHHPPV